MITDKTLNDLNQLTNCIIDKRKGKSILSAIADLNSLLYPIPQYVGKEHPAFEQGKTGYCWLSALLFCIYQYGEKACSGSGKLLSKSYLVFYDKLEKANLFLELLIEQLDGKQDNRVINYLFKNAMTDQGQWEMGVNLIRKYGVVPYESMPDTSTNTSNVELNACLSLILRCTAVNLFKIHETKDSKALQAEKQNCLQSVYRILVNFYGPPPQNVGTLTPTQYNNQQVSFPFDHYISISSTGLAPFVQYEVALDGNVAEGHKNTFLSVPDTNFEQAIIRQVEEEGFCWFTCDIGKFYLKNLNLLDDSLFDFDQIMQGADYKKLTRRELFQSHIASMTHAMTLCNHLKGGYFIAKNSNVIEENKFGSYCTISTSWFRKYIFQAVVKKTLLSDTMIDKIPVKTVMPWEFFDSEL